MTIRGWLASSYYARTRNSALLSAMLFLACVLSYTRAHAQEATVAQRMETLLSRDAAARVAAEKSLLAEGPAAVPGIVSVAAETRHGRAIAAKLLPKMGVPATKALIGLLQDPELRSTSGALLFQTIGTDAHALAPSLLECLHDPAVMNDCGGALVRAMSPHATAQVTLLIKALGDREPVVRAYAAGALGAIGPKAAAAAPALVAGLKSAEPGLRASAATALGRLGVKTPEVLAALRAAKKDADADTRRAAIDALKRLHV